MYEETPKQEKIEIDKNNKILFISNKTIKNPKESNTINSKYTTNDYTQKQNIDKLNSNKDNENENQNINDNTYSKISLNKEQLYETFLLFQNYLSSNKNNFEINNNQNKDEISPFNFDNEEKNKKILSKLQFYNKQNKPKSITKDISNNFKNINHSKVSKKKYLNESFASNTKNVSNDYSCDFSNNNLETYTASIGDSLQIMAYDLLSNKNKKKLNSMNVTCKSTKSREIKNICNNSNYKQLKSDDRREISDYKNKNKENELLKNIKKIKVTKCKEEFKRETNDKTNREQIILDKIKELNYETMKFREEKDKVIKIKNEYEQLREKLIKDIDDFNKRKIDFEKYKAEEINKIKEEKERLLIERNELNNTKFESLSSNISTKDDKETINNLKKYISELKSTIQKQERELKLLSQNDNNINNYTFNGYKTLNISGHIGKKNSQIKTLRNSSKTLKEEIAKEFMSNLSCSKIKPTFIQNNFDKNNKSISLMNINDYSKIDKNSINNEISNKKNNPNLKLNTSMNIGKLKTKIKYILNKNCPQKETKNVKDNNKKIKRNNEIKKNILKNKEEIKNKTDKFSKTTTNFMQNKKTTKEDQINNNLDNNFNLEDEINKPLNAKDYDFIIPEKYLKNNFTFIKKEKIEDKEIYLYNKNKKDIIFQSGLKKEIFDDGFEIIYFNNGDIKQSHPDGKNIYFFKESNTVQTTYPNGINIFKFSNGQIESHFPNGLKKVLFPNGTTDLIFEEEKTENI